jgi:hypothetical protein
MKLKNEMMFWDADDGGDGGGVATEESSRGLDVFEGTGEQTAKPEAAPERQSAPPQAEREARQPMVDAGELAERFGNVIGQHFKAPPKEITVEEAKKLLNVWEPTKEWLARYDNLETRDQAIAEQRDGLIRQADTIMRYRMNEMQQAMEQRYGPVIGYMQQQEAQQGEHRFAQTFPQLNHQSLRPLLFSVAQSLLASGTRFNDERQLFTAIARGVESVIKVSNPQFSLESNGANGQGAAVPAGTRRTGHTPGAIPVTTPGSGGGGGGQKGTGPPKPRGLAIFDP